MITIVYSHPYEKSFNHAILQAITKQLDDNNRKYTIIDLYADKFNPTMTGADLALYSKGKSADNNAEKYQQILKSTDQLIFIFPIWWGMFPAILKGFFDKTFLRGSILDYTPEGKLIPKLSVNKTTLITTSQNDSKIMAPFINDYFIPLVLNPVGINNVTWHNCDRVKSQSTEYRELFLYRVLANITE